jgi:hypothetical protein
MPDAWEQQVLMQFGARAQQGETLTEMTFSEMVAEPGGRYFRFMQAIGVQPLCLGCHGERQHISKSVQRTLTNSYPSDQAIGYKIGELRGAVSIKQPLD